MTNQAERETVLLVEDDETFRYVLAEVLGAQGYSVSACSDSPRALEALQHTSIDVVVTDLEMPGMGGGALLGQIRAAFPEIPVIAMTAFGSIENAVELTRAGAANYVAKPFRTQVLFDAIRRALDESRTAREQAQLRRWSGAHLEGLIGTTPSMVSLFKGIGRVAHSPAPVVVRGETGVGKDVVARAIHRASGRGPFVPVNCGAIPEHLIESELFGHKKGAFTGADRDKRGLFEVASGGTLFLDEIGELPLSLQPKLLRVIETGELRPVGGIESQRVDVRIIAATHRDLEAAVQAGAFREDLYWRIQVLHLRIPPLRERATDIPLFVGDFLECLARSRGVQKRISPRATSALASYTWPGNVRQLLGVLEQVVTFVDGSEIDLEDLPESIRAHGAERPLPQTAADRCLTLVELEREYISEILRRTSGNRKRAAEWLGIPRRTFYRRLEEYGFAPELCHPGTSG
jgi:DNA-binding NtrC family response regulator